MNQEMYTYIQQVTDGEDKDCAITVESVSKSFRIPHQKISTVRGAFVNALKKKSYETFKAVNDISFEVKKGEFFSIIGKNGSGKSTLLKMLAGIYQGDKGCITIDGGISPFFQLGIGFNPELTGRENVFLNATILGLTTEQIRQKFHSIVEFSGVERFIDQKMKNYSSGMRSRLAFAVAIHVNKDILIMDEVFAVGDAQFREKGLQEFIRLKEEGKTIILVSHGIPSVRRFSDRVMVINQGKQLFVGDPEKAIEVYKTVANS